MIARATVIAFAASIYCGGQLASAESNLLLGHGFAKFDVLSISVRPNFHHVIDEACLVVNCGSSKSIIDTPDEPEIDDSPALFHEGHILEIGLLRSGDWKNATPIPRRIVISGEHCSAHGQNCIKRRLRDPKTAPLLTEATLRDFEVATMRRRRSIQKGKWLDIERGGMPHVGDGNIDRQPEVRPGWEEIPFYRNFNFQPWPLFGLHFIELSLHDSLLPKQEEGGDGGYSYRSDIKSEAPPIPFRNSLPLGLLLIGSYFAVVVYVLKRADYTIPIGVIVAWPIFALGFSFVLYQRCPSFFETLYSALPVCRYVTP